MFEYIGVRFMSREDIKLFLRKLDAAGIEYKCYGTLIITATKHIKCVVIPERMREIVFVQGMRFNKCFNFVEDDTKHYLTRRIDDDVDLVEYIKSKEEK